MKQHKAYVNHYAFLEIPKFSDGSVVESAYKQMVRKWHPDRFSDKAKKKEAEARIKMINAAFDVLGHPQKKKLYDVGMDPTGHLAQPIRLPFGPHLFGDGG